MAYPTNQSRAMPLNSLASPLLALPRVAKRGLVLVMDASLCVLCVWFAFYLRMGEFVPLSGAPLWAALVSIGIALPIFIVLGLYRAIFRYAGWPALMTVAKAIGIYGVIYAALFTAIGFAGIPRTVGIIQPILLLFIVGASRAFARFWLGGLYQSQLKLATLPKVLIYGAGNAGRQLAAAMANSLEMRVVGFVDDDVLLHGQVLNGLTIYSPADLGGLTETLGISDVLLALPTASRKRRNEILALMGRAHVAVRTLPSVTELAQGKVSTSDVRELDIDDLLGREPVTPHMGLLAKNTAGKVVLVTGAGGSIGSELCRQILKQGPARLLLVDHSEYALYAIHDELQAQNTAPLDTGCLIPLLASVRDAARLQDIFAAWKPDTVYHAAAYKHVPLVEHNPVEGLRNNIWGTWVAARCAQANGVADFVLISTDKAVRPTNTMGASKRLAEMVLQAMAAQRGGTRFSMVRFGNVLGSSGSVVPRFRQQIRDGGPITLTHADITRYFMTIPEAAQLVIQAGAMAQGGDVFVLDMGEPVRIMDLATRMVELSGLSVRSDTTPEGDIAIEITGLRPGEKLFEELLIGDNPLPTTHARIMKAHEECLPLPKLEGYLAEMATALDASDLERVRALLGALVSGFQPSDGIVDWIHQHKHSTQPVN